MVYITECLLGLLISIVVISGRRCPKPVCFPLPSAVKRLNYVLFQVHQTSSAAEEEAKEL